MKVNNNETTRGISNRELNRLFNNVNNVIDDPEECGIALTEVEDAKAKNENKKHFKLTEETIEYKGHTLYRIQCIETFIIDNSMLKENFDEKELTIKEGEFGGFVESENNLDGNAWIQENAKVFGEAKVYGNAVVAGDAVVCDRASVHNNAIVYGNALIEDNAYISGKSSIGDNAKVYENAEICGKSKVCDKARVRNNAKVHSSYIEDCAIIEDYANIEDANISGNVKIGGNAQISKITINNCNAKILNDAKINKEYDYMCFTNVGSRKDTLTAYRTKHNGVRITIGCFFGDLVEFRKDVAKKEEKEALIKKEYELIADVIQHRFIDNNTEDYLKELKYCENE